MSSAIQPRAVWLDCIEQQSTLGAILHWVRHYRNWVARFVRRRIPTLTDHDVDARSLDIPRSYSRGVLRVSANRDDDLAVGVLPAILLHDTRIGCILSHIKHRAGMMGEGWASGKKQESRHDDRLHLVSSRENRCRCRLSVALFSTSRAAVASSFMDSGFVAYNLFTLYADHVSYPAQEKVLRANGRVVMVNPDGRTAV